MKLGVHFSSRRVTLVLVSASSTRKVLSHRFDADVGWRELVQAYADILEGVVSAEPQQQLESATFDVGEILELPGEQLVHVVRIAPRKPVDPSHEPNINYGEITVSVTDVIGGHSAKGQALVQLDEGHIHEVANTIIDGENVVVCAMGSLVNSEHEMRAGDLFYTHARPREVAYSHSFFSDDVTAREYTAVVNGVLQEKAESLAVELTRVSETRIPRSRLYVATNEGGCVPLARLSVTPIHMKFSHTATMCLGAAQLLDVADGRFAIVQDNETHVAEQVDGFFSVVPYRVGIAGVRIATTCVHTSRVTDPVRHEELHLPALTVGTTPGAIAVEELAAFGAAVAPLSDISTRTINLASGVTERQAMSDMEAKVRARLVAFGARPESIRVVESQSITSTYSSPDIISVRVRALESIHSEGRVACT